MNGGGDVRVVDGAVRGTDSDDANDAEETRKHVLETKDEAILSGDDVNSGPAADDSPPSVAGEEAALRPAPELAVTTAMDDVAASEDGEQQVESQEGGQQVESDVALVAHPQASDRADTLPVNSVNSAPRPRHWRQTAREPPPFSEPDRFLHVFVDARVPSLAAAAVDMVPCRPPATSLLQRETEAAILRCERDRRNNMEAAAAKDAADADARHSAAAVNRASAACDEDESWRHVRSARKRIDAAVKAAQSAEHAVERELRREAARLREAAAAAEAAEHTAASSRLPSRSVAPREQAWHAEAEALFEQAVAEAVRAAEAQRVEQLQAELAAVARRFPGASQALERLRERQRIERMSALRKRQLPSEVRTYLYARHMERMREGDRAALQGVVCSSI